MAFSSFCLGLPAISDLNFVKQKFINVDVPGQICTNFSRQLKEVLAMKTAVSVFFSNQFWEHLSCAVIQRVTVITVSCGIFSS